MNWMRLGLLAALVSLLLGEPKVLAQSRGGGKNSHSIGAAFGVNGANQTDMNSVISSANQTAGGISNSRMGSAYEFSLLYGYRFSRSMFEIGIRPSFSLQESRGSGSLGGYSYAFQGFSLFPTLRMIPLENDIFKFFLQTGVGYGILNGSIREPNLEVEFSGDRLGLMFGLGAEFCFSASHCIRVDGTVRYMPVERNIVSRQTGAATGGVLTQVGSGQELEIGNRDFSSTFTGVQGVVGYTYYF